MRRRLLRCMPRYHGVSATRRALYHFGYVETREKCRNFGVGVFCVCFHIMLIKTAAHLEH